MAKATTLKATILAAINTGAAKLYDDGKTVLHDGVLYSVRANGYRRMPAQKENRKRLGITIAKAAPAPAPVADTGVRKIIVPPVGRGRRAWVADFLAYAKREGVVPA